MAEGNYFPAGIRFAEIPSFKTLEDITGTEFNEAGEFTGTKAKKGMQIVIDREQGRCYYAPEDYGPEHLRYGIAKAQGAFTPEEWWGMEHDPDFGRHSAPWELAKRAFWGFAKLTDIGLRFGNDGTDAGLKLGPVTLFDGNGAGGQLYGAALAALREAKAPETAPELEGFYRRVSEWGKRKDEARRQALQLFDDSMMIHGLPGYIGEIIGSTAGSLLTAAAVGSVGGLPAVAAVFGSMQFHDLRAEYLEKKNPDGTPKYTIEEANRYAFEGGLKEGLIEMLGFKFFRRWATLNNSFRNWVLASVPEGLQEALQSIAEAELTTATGLRNEAIYGDDEKAKAEAWKSILLDIAISAAAGGIVGFGGAMLTKSTEIRRDKFEYELEKGSKEKPKLEYKDSSAREIPNPNVVKTEAKKDHSGEQNVPKIKNSTVIYDRAVDPAKPLPAQASQNGVYPDNGPAMPTSDSIAEPAETVNAADGETAERKTADGKKNEGKTRERYEKFVKEHSHLVEESPADWKGKTEDDVKKEINFDETKGYGEISSPIETVKITLGNIKHLIKENDIKRKTKLLRTLKTIQKPNLIIEAPGHKDYNRDKTYHYYIKLFTVEGKTKPHWQIVKIAPDGNFYTTNFGSDKKQIDETMERGKTIYDLSSLPGIALNDSQAVYRTESQALPTSDSIAEPAETVNAAGIETAERKTAALPFAAAISDEDRAAWERAEQNKGSDPLHDMAKAIAADYKFHDEDGIIAAYAVARRLAENGHAADLVFEGLNRQLIAFNNQLESGEAKAATEKAAEQIKYYLSPESVKDFKGNLKKQLKDGGFEEHEAERGAEGISRIYAYLSNAFGMDIAELRPLNLKAGQDTGSGRAAISLDDKIAEIIFGKNSDLSSVFHEFMHYFTDVIDRAAAQGNAKAAELKKEIDRIASGYNKRHTNISGQTSDEQKLRMEAVAEAFEMWLYEDRKAGQDTEADRLFKEIQDFFRKIYDCLKSISGVRLDPDTDAFFRKICGLDDIALTEYMRKAEQQGTRLYQSGKKRIDYSKDGKYYENFLETHKNLITEKPPKWEDITEQALKDEIKFNEEKGYAEVQSPIDIVRFSDDSFYHLFVQNNKGRKELARRALLAIKEPNLIIECIEPNKKGCLTKFHYYIKLLKGKNESGEEEITVHMQLVKVLSGETWYVTNYPIYPNKFANKMKNGEVIYDLSAHPTTLLPLQAAQDGVYPNNRPSIATNYSITENSEKNNPNNGQTFFQSGKEDSNKFILPEALSRANERVEPVVIERHFADRKESKEIELDEVISILDKKLNVKKGDIRKINNDNGETVILSKNSIDEMFNHTSIRDGLNIGGILGKEAIANLPEIFKTAVPIAITDDLKRESSTKFIRYGNVFESDGEIFLIKITVKEFANNRKLLTDVEIEHNKGRDLAAYDIKVARRDTIQGKIKEAAAGNISTDKSLALRNGSDYIISDLLFRRITNGCF